MVLKNTLFSLAFCCLLVSLAAAQNEGNTKDGKLSLKDQGQFEKAQTDLDQKGYRLALPVFENLLAKYPNNTKIKYFTALCYISRPDKYPVMLDYLNDVYTENRKADRIEFLLAQASFLNLKLKEATDYLTTYLAKTKNLSAAEKKETEKLKSYINNARLLMANPLKVTKTNLGNEINTPFAETSPYANSADSMMIYTYRGNLCTGGLQNANNEPDSAGLYYEDVFIAYKTNNTWSHPQNLTAVNSNNNDEALSISYDGKMIFISRDNLQDDGDIYMSRWENNQWAAPVKLQGDVNTAAWEDNCTLTPDGKTLYFSSNRPGGFGGKDIYRSTLQADGITWGPAHNLGDKINTLEDEDDPFIHLDGRLLLFSSKGHNSMGGYDVFKTFFNPFDSTWSVPENLGYPISTVDDDVHYYLSPGGDKGYASVASPKGYGDYDLYSVEPGITGTMPAMLVVKGVVLLDNRPYGLNIEASTASLTQKYTSNASNGCYQLVLPLGQDYKITWKLNDTAFQTETIAASAVKDYFLKIKDISFKTNTETPGAPIPGLIFKIQVAAQGLNSKVDYNKVKDFGKVEKKVHNNMARFTLSKEYKTLDDANTALEQVRKLAVPDAFVICSYKGKRCYLYELYKQGVLVEKK